LEISILPQNLKTLKTLADFTINHFPEIKGNSQLCCLYKPLQKTREMIVHWQRVVCTWRYRTNMSILGLTIDYGPYGWLEDYNPIGPQIQQIGKSQVSFWQPSRNSLWIISVG
jgi:uncharacterized protein YdiU (UPF0061 family)